IVSCWISELQGRYAEEVEKRLGELAGSALRGLLRNHVKQQAAGKTGEAGAPGPWSNYSRIYNLYHGGKPSGSDPIPDWEKSFLRDEVHQFFSYERTEGVPNLAELVRLLKPLRPETVHLIRNLHVDPFKDGFDEWQDGLQLLGLKEAFQKNALQRHFNRGR